MEHTLTYEKGKITVDGVKKVEAFDETSARIILADNTVSFRGTGFVMVEMAQASGKMSFLGNVETISYKNKGEKTSFVKKTVQINVRHAYSAADSAAVPARRSRGVRYLRIFLYVQRISAAESGRLRRGFVFRCRLRRDFPFYRDTRQLRTDSVLRIPMFRRGLYHCAHNSEKHSAPHVFAVKRTIAELSENPQRKTE
jgi:hypothetical protein